MGEASGGRARGKGRAGAGREGLGSGGPPPLLSVLLLGFLPPLEFTEVRPRADFLARGFRNALPAPISWERLQRFCGLLEFPRAACIAWAGGGQRLGRASGGGGSYGYGDGLEVHWALPAWVRDPWVQVGCR